MVEKEVVVEGDVSNSFGVEPLRLVPSDIRPIKAWQRWFSAIVIRLLTFKD